MIKSDGERIASFSSGKYFIVYKAIITPENTISKNCVKRGRNVGACLHKIVDLQYRLFMLDKKIVVRGNGTMCKTIISTKIQLNVGTAITDETVVGINIC